MKVRRNREALEVQLEMLEQMHSETILDESPPQVCSRCYQTEDLCACSQYVPWPLQQVIIKLKALLCR